MSLKSLEPCEETDNFFTELCEYVKKDDFKDIKITQEIREINTRCVLAEYELEKYWNAKIVDSEDPRCAIRDFMYYDNYLKLTRLEIINAIHVFGDIRKVLFIGGGPLPLTSIILALEYGIESTIVDSSEEAVSLSISLIAALQMQDLIHVELGDAKDYIANTRFDLCSVASLVCASDDEDAIMQNLSSLALDNFLVRTSQNKRQILYKKTNERILRKYLTPLMFVHPKNDIINSFILLKKNHYE